MLENFISHTCVGRLLSRYCRCWQ